MELSLPSAHVSPCLSWDGLTHPTGTQKLLAGVLGAFGTAAAIGTTKGKSLGMRAALAAGGGVGGATTGMLIGCMVKEPPREYFVSLEKEPDFSSVQNDPTGVYELAHRHFAEHSGPVDAALGALQTKGVVTDYEPSPLANGFIVSVHGRALHTFEDAMRDVSGVGRVETGMSQAGVQPTS